MKHDIRTRADIVKMVDEFYVQVRKNHLLGPVFDEIMKTNWDTHLPKMYDFWENILFYTGSYKGHPFDAHLPVNAKVKLEPEYFRIWLLIFQSNIDRHFEGLNAEILKLKASNISNIWSHKMHAINRQTGNDTDGFDQPHSSL